MATVILAAVASAVPTRAEEPHGTAPVAPAELRLATLERMTPDDDPAAYVELATTVLGDLARNPSPSLEAEVRAGLGRALRVAGRFQDAVFELEVAADAARRFGRTDVLEASLADLARAHFYLGSFDQSIAACRRALDHPEIGSDPDRAWRFVNITAACQLQLGDYAGAIATSATSLDERQRAGDRDAEATLLNNIGVAHLYLGDYDPALEYFQRARLIKTELGESVGVADILANIGDIKQLQGKTGEAIEIHHRALAMRLEEGGDIRVAQSHRSLAAALRADNRLLDALGHIASALELVRRAGAEPELVVCLATEAEILAASGRGDEAVASATESLELARRLELRSSEIAALDAMVAAEAASGDPELALEFQARARELERELGRAETRSEFARFQASHDIAEKQREIELLRQTSDLQQLELKQQRRWRVGLSVGLALLGAVAGIGWFRSIQRGPRARDRELEQAALVESAERWRQMVVDNPAGLFQTDPDGMIVAANPAFAGLVGRRDPDRLVGTTLFELADDPSAVRELLGGLAVTRETSTRNLRVTGPGGGSTTLLVTVGRIADGARDVIEGIAIDISDHDRAEQNRRRAELDQQQNQKLEGLGVLAGGIAHDFNNMLMAVLSNISLAKRAAAASGEATRRLSEAEEVCLRATGLTQQLLTFSKGGRPIRSIADLGRLVEEATASAARGGNCHYDCRRNPELWPVEIDRGQITQVVHNLIVNAIEAMPRGGTVTVTIDNTHLVEGDIPALDAGRFVRIDVTDTGAGIPDDQLETIFDPFFSTKRGQSGLGLATAFSIVRGHGGAIVVHSKESRGSTFTVYLPASEQERSTEPPPGDGAIRGHGRLLIMDDDEAVRSAAAELLETIGYEVVTAADGAEAVEIYRRELEHDHRFDAVILDLTVPEGVGGRETMSRLLALDPGVRAIVSSGYSTDPVMANYREHGFSGVAVKPYRMAELARTLKRLIEPATDG